MCLKTVIQRLPNGYPITLSTITNVRLQFIDKITPNYS
jgi:hypothetical protein